MTLDESVELVMKALEESEGAEVFIPNIPSMKIVDLAKVINPNCTFDIVGIRPGEKLHETLITADDGKYTVQTKDRYITYPEVVYHKIKKITGTSALDSFEGYRSDNNDVWLSVEDLRKMMRKHEASK